jgi:EcsC protein family
MLLTDDDRRDLRYAKDLLEHPSLAAKIANLIGTPIEKGFELLPARWSDAVRNATHSALMRALELAVATLDDRRLLPSRNLFHRLAVSTSGAVGGAFGLPALALELPVSTTVMLRSIADVARSEGEAIKSLDAKLACLVVFALGSPARSDDSAEAGYFVVRAGLARAVSEAAEYIVERGLAEEGAPAILRLIGQIAARFGATVSEKVAAQAIPVVGAAGGAIVNLVFIDHFQDMARGHFIVRRLERTYGQEAIQAEYELL